MDSVFIDTSIILGIAIGVAFLVQLFKQPMIISYIITGLIVGPLFLNLINDSQEFFNVFAELGVILLLFLVGLSLNIDYLRKIGKVAAVTGIGQVIFTSIIGFGVLLLLGFAKSASAFLAVSITFSSTIIIMKLLTDKQEASSVYGRYTIGLMLVQDIIAILIMILLPSLTGEKSLLFSMLSLIAKSSALFFAVYLLTRAILPKFLDNAAKSGEFLLIFSLAWCFALAGLAEMAGLTLEVGAIIAGLSLGSSPYQAEISSRIKPLRDFFIALFFIILGSEMKIGNLQASLWPGLILSLFILVGNPLILYLLFRAMKFTRRNSFLAGLTAAQVSEFGFVLLFLGQKMGYFGDELLPVFTLVALSTIFISTYLITHSSRIYDLIAPYLNKFGKDDYQCPDDVCERYDVIVFGYHRLGWKICQSLADMKASFAVVDFDPAAVKKLADRKIPHFFGDATEVEFLDELPFRQAKIVISTIPDADGQLTLIKHVRKVNRKALIIGNLAHVRFINTLYEAGADYVMMPHLVSGQWISEVLKKQAWNRRTFKKLYNMQKEEMNLRITLGH